MAVVKLMLIAELFNFTSNVSGWYILLFDFNYIVFGNTIKELEVLKFLAYF